MDYSQLNGGGGEGGGKSASSAASATSGNNFALTDGQGGLTPIGIIGVAAVTIVGLVIALAVILKK